MNSLFPQNVVAVIWDFDKTLTPHYMQAPLFKRFGVDEAKFWKEANGLEYFYVARRQTLLDKMLAAIRSVRHSQPPASS